MPGIVASCLLVWWAAVSVVAVAITVYDKIAAKRRPRRRIRERTLLLVGALGGAAAMYVTMLLIRHKTLHKQFTVGLPLMIAAHAGVAYAVFRFSARP